MSDNRGWFTDLTALVMLLQVANHARPGPLADLYHDALDRYWRGLCGRYGLEGAWELVGDFDRVLAELIESLEGK